MQQIKTRAVVLRRINFGEADRILTALTPNHGKLALIAKGVRKSISKLAGGIETLSESDISYIPGKGDVSTLVSARLVKHYDQIVGSLDRVSLASTAMSLLDKITQHNAETEHYNLAVECLSALDQLDLSLSLIELWFYARILKILGREFNTEISEEDSKSQSFSFSLESMSFGSSKLGKLNQEHIKLIRLLQANSPSTLNRITGIENYSTDLLPIYRQASQLVLN